MPLHRSPVLTPQVLGGYRLSGPGYTGRTCATRCGVKGRPEPVPDRCCQRANAVRVRRRSIYVPWPDRFHTETPLQTKLACLVESAACLEESWCPLGHYARASARAHAISADDVPAGRSRRKTSLRSKLESHVESAACLEKLPGPCRQRSATDKAVTRAAGTRVQAEQEFSERG